MYCKNCGSELEPNQKVCAKCGAEQDSSAPKDAVEDVSADADASKQEDEEEGSWIGGLIVIALIGVAIWALVHFNPSEEDHYDKVRESLVEQVEEDGSNPFNAALALDKLKYKSIGVASWTYVKYKGHTHLGSIGLCGFVIPFIGIE